MDHSDQSQQQPLSFHNQQSGSGSMSPVGTPAGAVPSPQHQHPAFNQAQHFQAQQKHHHLLQAFWDNQMQEIDRAVDFKNHSLPLARIKKIMKADEDVRMISAEAPVVFAKACEIFVLELTLRSWIHTEENKRRTLQKNDIAAAVSRNDVFDFLVDIIPRDEMKEEGLGIGSSGEALQYYCVPARAAVDHHASALYGGRPASPFMPLTQGNSGHYLSQQAPTEQQPSDS